MKKLICLLMSIMLAVGAFPLSSYLSRLTPKVSIEEFTAELVDMQREYEEQPVSNRLIVKSKYNIPALDSVAIAEGYNDLHIVQFDNSQSAGKALAYYEEQSLIEYAEADMTMTICETTGITYDNHLSWGSSAIGVDDYIDYLGDISTLPEVVVGIIDTGIDLDHEFLQDRIIPTGFNVSSSGSSDSEDDDNGHGTHVAGIVVDNTTDNVKVKAYKVLDEKGSGYMSDTITAIYNSIEDNVDVINMSLGTRSDSNICEDVINLATQQGIAVCVSAGNDGASAEHYIPANVESAITVAAIDYNNTFPYWTNYGSSVDIIAPGVSIYSSYRDNEYKTLSGTSMACPFVTASCALIKSKDKNITVKSILNTLEANGKPCPPTSKFSNQPLLYIGDITSYEYQRTPSPTFSVSSGRYDNQIELMLFCDDENAEIYYTTNGKRATENNGILYTNPIIIDSVTSVHAVAYSHGKLKSLQAKAEYYITHTDDEDKFEINDNGIITKYYGNNDYLTIPNTINNIVVTGIGNYVFANSSITMIKFPETLTSVGRNAFYNCKNLISLYAENLLNVGYEAFYNCKKLQDIDLTKLTCVDKYAFYACESIQYIENNMLTEIEDYAFADIFDAISVKFDNVVTIKKGGLRDAQQAKSIFIPNLETVYPQAFEGCYSVIELNFPKLTNIENVKNNTYFGFCELLEIFNAPNLLGDLPDEFFYCCQSLKEIRLNNVTSIGEYCFYFNENLQTVYLPNVKIIKPHAFDNCGNVDVIYLPTVETINSLPQCDGINLYLSNNFTKGTRNNFTENIIAPTGSYAQEWAEANGHTFLDSESCSFTGASGGDLIYTCSTNNEVCTMPTDIVLQMWKDYLPLNENPDFMAHGFLFNLVPDNIINARDFAKIHHI